MALIPTDTTASPTRRAVDIPLHHRMTITSSSHNRPIRSVGDGPVSCICDIWAQSTNIAVDTPSLPPACLPLFADPLSTLALPLHGPFVYVLVHSILHRRTGYAVPAFTNSLLAAWCTAPIRSDPHRTHPIESDLTGPDRMGPQPTSGAPAAWPPSHPHAHANQPST